MLAEFVAVGFLGGLVRALYGLLKAVNNGVVVSWKYFVLTLAVSCVLGALLGSVFSVSYQVAALAGYVGTDMLENVAAGVLPGSIFLRKDE